jgi:hypothetical protein
LSFQDFAYAPVAHEERYYNLYLRRSLGLIENIIRELEKDSSIQTVFETGCVEPGVDNFDCPLRRIISDLEK